MTALPDACDSLAAWLTPAAALLPFADDDGTVSTSHATSSRPPWNPAAAAAYLDAHEGIRRLEATLRQLVTGRPGHRRGGSDANTRAALKAITSLSEAIPQPAASKAARILTRWAVTIQQLPAIDELPKLDRIYGLECLYCGVNYLLAARQSGMVTCGVPDCTGDDGRKRWAHVEMGRLGPILAWPDGSVQ